METAKIRVKVGNLEVEYEGIQSFVGEGFLDLVNQVVGLAGRAPVERTADQPDADSRRAGGTGDVPTHLTTNTIAAHVGVEGPQELILCAIAKLQIVDCKQKVEKSEISEEMRSATTYYNDNMRKNFARDLIRMVKAKKINQIAGDTYALAAPTRAELEAKIAAIE